METTEATFDDADKRIVADIVWRNPWVWTWCVRNPENERKVGRIAQTVWPSCSSNNSAIAPVGSAVFKDHCVNLLKGRDDYKETVSFIPFAFLLQIIIPIIIKLLIDYFLAKTGKGKWQTNPS